jgi:hypothetical protein
MLPRIAPAACAAVVCLATAAAFASPQFSSTFQASYSSQEPGSSSAFDALASWSDPGEPGGKPKELRRITVTMNPGSRLDTSALPYCKASDEDVQALAVRACPAATKLGEVHTQGVYAGSPAPFNTLATLFNARRQIIVVVQLDNRHGMLLTNFRDDVKRSSIRINLKIGKGISLIRFQAHVPRHQRKRHGKRKAYFTTPKSCPATGVWTTSVLFEYRDGSSDQHTSTTPCRKSSTG